MSEETLPRAIEPFFSTKGVGKGTGLGLSMAHGLATQLGGVLKISSTLNVGSNIEFYLPVWTGTIVADGDSKPQPASHQHTGNALLVDDENSVRAITSDMLRALGFDVLEASSGDEAMRVLLSSKKVDLLVTDHMMPGMTDTTLANLAKKEHPDLVILVTSGYFDTESTDSSFRCLQKPFSQAELAEIIGSMTAKR